MVGAGPAGRALAHRAALAGLQVTVIDPQVESPWRATYAAWADDLPTWLDDSVIAARCDGVAVFTPAHRRLQRRYVTLNTAALQHSLTLDEGIVIHAQRTAEVHPGSIRLEDGTLIEARAVVDARGLRDPKAPAQSAYGVVVDRTLAAPVLDADDAILMDWRGASAHRTPTFLYAIPLDDSRVLLEETCLAASPAMPIAALRERLGKRLAGFDIDPTSLEPSQTETVRFALSDSSGLPWASAGPLRFGAAGGMVHPATGYSVAESLSSVDQLVSAYARGRNPVKALWPRQARAVYRLRLRGLAVLLSLSSADLTAFFEAFFAAPAKLQNAYLSDRHHLGGTLGAMVGTISHADMRLSGTIVRSAIRSGGPGH